MKKPFVSMSIFSLRLNRVLCGLMLSINSLLIAQPSNDNFASAVVLSIDNYCSADAEFTTASATADGPLPSQWTGIHSNVWFKFQATTANVSIDLKIGDAEGTLRRPQLSLHDASTAELVSNHEHGNAVDIGLSHEGLTVGAWYYINVDNGSHSTNPGTFTLCVNSASTHDYPSGAFEIPHTSAWCSGLAGYTTVIATPDGPTPSQWGSVDANVWFKFQATTTSVSIDLKTGATEGTLREPQLSLHTAGLVEIKSNGDHGDLVDIGLSHDGLVVGEWYYINVDNGSHPTHPGTFTLCLENTPSMDYPSGAFVLDDTNGWCSGNGEFTTVIGSPDGAVPSQWTGVYANVWFKFRAKGSRVTVQLNTGDVQGSLRHPNLALHDATLGELQSVGSAGDYTDRVIDYTQLVTGDWYYINVGNGYHSTHPGTFSLCVDNGLGHDDQGDALDITLGSSAWSSGPDAYDNYYSTNDGPASWLLGNVWFKFQATDTAMRVTLERGTMPDTCVLALFDENLQEVVSTRFTLEDQLVARGLQTGQWYYLSVGSDRLVSGTSSTFGLMLENGVVQNSLEIQALRDLYESTGGVNWTDNTGWPSTSAAWDTIKSVDQIIGWHGVTVLNGDVTEMVLPENNLTGGLPPSIGDLLGLEVLNFDGLGNTNRLSGPIPGSITKLVNLKSLGLSRNQLSGPIPADIGNLTQLGALVLYENELTGPLPASITSLTSLNLLFVRDNQLTGAIPSDIGAMQSLIHITLNNNQLTGDLPISINNLSSLRTLLLHHNQLTGPIPLLDNTLLLPTAQLLLHANNFVGFADYNTHPNLSNLEVWIQDNYIPQADIDANIVGGAPIFAAFTYAPQKEVPAGQGQVLDFVEISALKDFYESTGGVNWTDNTGWPATPVEWEAITSIDQAATWFGVTVDSSDVIALDLRDNNLLGTIPGTLADLLWLEQLDLSVNQLSGEIPPGIFDLAYINNLSLSRNSLSGPIPSNVGNALNLQALSLAINDLTGEIPVSIGNLKKCVHLFLHDLNLEGGIPKEIGGMESLGYLHLDDSNLSGQIPRELGACSRLQTLYLRRNNFSGPLPASMGDLTRLSSLALRYNKFTGAFPESVALLPELAAIEIFDNQFTSFPDISSHPNAANLQVSIQRNYIPWDDIAANLNVDSTHNFEIFHYEPQLEVPSGEGQVLDIAEIASLKDLYEYTHGANWTDNTGWPSTPTEWEAITSIDQAATWFGVTVENGDVSALVMENNELAGDLPESLYLLRGLSNLSLVTNALTGTLSPLIGDLMELTVLNLASNDLSGELPSTLSRLSNVITLSLMDNAFSGPLDRVDFSAMGSLKNLYLQVNQLAGTIPSTLEACPLLRVVLFSNQLSGEIPAFLFNKSSLLVLSLGDNQLTGTLPGTHQLPALEELILSHNQLTGEIPAEWGQLSNLTLLDLSHNNFTGPIPDALGNLSNLSTLRLDVNELTGSIPAGWASNANLRILSLSSNNFTSFPGFSLNPNAHLIEVNIQDNFIPQVDINTNIFNGQPIFDIYQYSGQRLADPSGLKLIDQSVDALTLSWTVAATATEYVIERSNNGSTGFTVIGTTNQGTSKFTDEGLTPQTNYYYRVKASNDTDESGYSLVLEVTTAQDLPADVTQTHQPQYNGNISAVKWQGYGDAQENLYTYHYDPMSRLEAAHYSRGVTTGGTWTAITRQGGFSVHDIQYDLNGNIQQLKRQAFEEEVKTIDALSYSYPNGNQLSSVSDPAGWSGFSDRNPGVDYAYDDNGNMIQDLNKEITRITYNHLNLPDTVLKADGSYITYLYDATGIKLAQAVYNTSHELIKKTEYVGEFIYESAGTPGTELAFIHHDEGRIVPNPVGDGYDYEYYLKDHLGNTRVVFTTNPKTTDFTATMESEAAADEEALFSNLPETRVKFAAASHSPDKVAKLDALNPVGPAISLEVGAGDTVQIEGYAFFEGGTGYDSPGNLPAFVAAVAGAFGGLDGSPVPSEQATFDLFDNAYGLIGLQGTDSTSVPAAYLNYILFDQDMAYKRSGFKQITSTANFNQEYVTFPDDIVIPEAGFIYCFVSMESATGRVLWDDFKVTVIEHPVVQRNSYYPFGLTFNEYQRVTAKPNQWKFTGKERITDLDLNWDDFGARMYMPDIGRWGVVDPMAEKYYDYSPYAYALNNPVNFIDPDGMQVIDPNDDINKALTAVGKQQGYEVSFNKETQMSTVHKTSATYSKDKVSTNSNANITLTESVYKIDSDGNLVDATITTSAVSASFEESIDMFGNVERSVSDASISKTDHMFATESHDASALDKMAKSDLVLEGVSMLLKSPNRNALSMQDSGLPFLSLYDKFENNKGNIIQGLGALTGRETGGVEKLFGGKDNTTLMRFQLNQAAEANDKFHKLSMSRSSFQRQ